MKNKLTDLNNYLFEQIERINEDDLNGEQLDKTIAKAEAITKISIRQLSQVLKWGYSTVNNRLCLPQFSQFIGGSSYNRTIKIEHLPIVTKLLYEVMGEPA